MHINILAHECWKWKIIKKINPLRIDHRWRKDHCSYLLFNFAPSSYSSSTFYWWLLDILMFPSIGFLFSHQFLALWPLLLQLNHLTPCFLDLYVASHICLFYKFPLFASFFLVASWACLFPPLLSSKHPTISSYFIFFIGDVTSSFLNKSLSIFLAKLSWLIKKVSNYKSHSWVGIFKL